jgi:hypothetical protein
MQALGVAAGTKWLKHYSSDQSILTVGDGDFSFSLALATAFGSGKNIVATSLDSYGSVPLLVLPWSSPLKASLLASKDPILILAGLIRMIILSLHFALNNLLHVHFLRANVLRQRN